MTARGFNGHIPQFRVLRPNLGDAWYVLGLALPVIAARVALR